MLLRVRSEDMGWLNLCRPLISERELRLILWADGDNADLLQREAVDFSSWIVRVVAVPPVRLPGFVVDNLRAALAAAVEVAWHGPSLSAALEAAGCTDGVVHLDPRRPHAELVEALTRPGVPVAHPVRQERDRWAILLAMARARTPTTWIALAPLVDLPGLWRLDTAQDDWDAAAERLRNAGFTHPALRAAWVDLESGRLDAMSRGESRHWSDQEVASVQVPPFVLRARGTDPGVVAARRRALESAELGPALLELAGLREKTPNEQLITALAAGGFFDVAADLALVRRERDVAVDFADLVGWLDRLGYIREALSVAQQWLTAAGDASSLDRATSLRWIGTLEAKLGRGAQARRDLEAAAALARTLPRGGDDPSGALWLLANVYGALGDLNLSFGDSSAARRCYDDALAVCEAPIKGGPEHDERLDDLADAYDRIAILHRLHGKPTEVRRRHEAALAARTAVLGRHSQDSEARRAQARSFGNIAEMFLASGDARMARQYCEDARALFEALADREPCRADLMLDLAAAWTRCGRQRNAVAEHGAAYECFDHAKQLLMPLAGREPARSDVHCELAVASTGLGAASRGRGEAASARQHYEEALSIGSALLAQEPGRVDLRLAIAVTRRALGDLQSSLGDQEAALRCYQEALAYISAVAVQEPARVDLRRDLAELHDRLTDLHLGVGEPVAARFHFEQAVNIHRCLLERDDVASAVPTLLMVTASPSNRNRIDVDAELRDISSRLRRPVRQKLLRIVHLPAAGFQDLRDALILHRSHILHISTFGESDGSLQFETRTEPAVKIQWLVELLRGELRLVVLGTCDSGALAERLAQIVGLAIGAIGSLSDRDMISFSAAFYGALGWGASVERAFASGLAGVEYDESGLRLFPAAEQDLAAKGKQRLLPADPLHRIVAPLEPSWTALMVSSNGVDKPRLRVDMEFRMIEQRVRETPFGHRFDFVWRMAARFDDLQRALVEHRPQMLHFAGTGEHDGSLRFETDAGASVNIPRSRVLRLLRAVGEDLRLVVLSAEYSTGLAGDLPPGIDAAIGIDEPVPDHSCIAFSVAFYEALGYGRPLKNAFAVALSAVDPGDQESFRLFRTTGSDVQANNHAPRPLFEGIPTRPTGATVTALMVSASPASQVRVRADLELRSILRSTRQTPFGRRFEFVQLPAARFDDLRTALLEHRPHILHIVAHGRDDGALCFEAENDGEAWIPRLQLLQLLNAAGEDLRLVVLNCEHSAELASDLTTAVDAAIGFPRRIIDTEAAAFMPAFYEALGFGDSFETAYTLARRVFEGDDTELVRLFPPADADPDGKRQRALIDDEAASK